ncbi:MAG: hypothetical protein ACXWWC_12940 [Chitinophagaceae bacterium]
MLQVFFMRYFTLTILLTGVFTLLSSTSNSRLPKTVGPPPTSLNTSTKLKLKELEKVLLERKATQFILGKSQKGRNVEAYFVPGTSNKRALILGGIHGSELSSIEVAKELLQQLKKGDSIFYNVIIVPSLFPDNAVKAKQNISELGSEKNIGRYTYAGAVDPNRQMPTPGIAFDEEYNLDHAGRKIENENTLLLELINQYRPQRMVSLHAIRNTDYAGIFADPRTDHNGLALGFATDSSLAIAIATSIEKQGGYTPGNRLNKKPTALYYKDPATVAERQLQKRNMTGVTLAGYRGGGVSLGTWASTAVADSSNPSKNREAIRILTIEFPGSKRPIDHKKETQAFYERQVELYAAALKNIFLGDYFTEENVNDENRTMTDERISAN